MEVNNIITVMKKGETMTERRCDLCQHERDLPCADKDCNFMNGYPCFEPKGEEKEDTRCATCLYWAVVEIGNYCPDCGQKL